jgi:hypothetical protein
LNKLLCFRKKKEKANNLHIILTDIIFPFVYSCGMSTIKTEIHTALLIHVTDEESKTTKNNSLTDLLENYFSSESMDGCYCDNCQSNQRKSIKYTLEKLPR